MRRLVIIVTLLAVGRGASAQAQVAAERPNVIFGLADDLDKRLRLMFTQSAQRQARR